MIIAYEVANGEGCVFNVDVALIGPSLADAAAWFSNGRSLSPSESVLMIITEDES
jgi:cytochrome c551/c552